MYRPPGQLDFIEKFSNGILNSSNFDNQEVYIPGNFNVNLLDDSNLVKSYKAVCSLHVLKQIITSSTCITENTSTLIDHILTNSVDKVSQFGVLEIALSDHHAILCTRKTLKQKYHKH